MNFTSSFTPHALHLWDSPIPCRGPYQFDVILLNFLCYYLRQMVIQIHPKQFYNENYKTIWMIEIKKKKIILTLWLESEKGFMFIWWIKLIRTSLHFTAQFILVLVNCTFRFFQSFSSWGISFGTNKTNFKQN